jgi:hypothetical protein
VDEVEYDEATDIDGLRINVKRTEDATDDAQAFLALREVRLIRKALESLAERVFVEGSVDAETHERWEQP